MRIKLRVNLQDVGGVGDVVNVKRELAEQYCESRWATAVDAVEEPAESAEAPQHEGVSTGMLDDGLPTGDEPSADDPNVPEPSHGGTVPE